MNKLSKHVMGMKFMRRTKEEVIKEKTESTFRHHFGKSEVKAETKGSKSKKQNETKPALTSMEIIQVGSYSQCEGHIFGRQSFGGFNPVVEYNVSHGIWKPFYLDVGDDTVKSKPEPEPESEEDSEMDVGDKEMAKTFGSLVGTLGKRFLRKRDKGGKAVKEEVKRNEKSPPKQVKTEKKSGLRSSKRNKPEEAGTSADNAITIDDEPPPQKKRKFRKPKD